MKKVLCYGDSNTFGYNPSDGARFGADVRWTSLLGKLLGQQYKIIEEGCNNRTGFVNNPAGFLYSSQKHFPEMISKMKNIDILVLGIGTNDLQYLFDVDFKIIKNGLETLLIVAKKYVNNIIVVPPVVLNSDVLNGHFNYQFDVTSIDKSKKVGEIYKDLVNLYKCRIFDFNEFVKPSKEDGLHYTAESHRLISEKLAEFIKTFVV